MACQCLQVDLTCPCGADRVDVKVFINAFSAQMAAELAVAAAKPCIHCYAVVGVCGSARAERSIPVTFHHYPPILVWDGGKWRERNEDEGWESGQSLFWS